MSDQILIECLRAQAEQQNLIARTAMQTAADRIEALVKEVERRIEPEQVENLVKMADPIMSELYAVEYSCRQEAEAKLAKAVEWFKKLDRRGDIWEFFDPVVHEVVTAALAELEGRG